MGSIVTLECLGHLPGDRFLDAVTQEGRVKLSPSAAPPFTGANWEVGPDPNGGPGDVFASAGHVFGPRYLDGRTQDGFVQTVGDTLPPFSGTRWRVNRISGDEVTIESLGEFKDPRFLFLDGVTHEGRVQLVDTTEPPRTGTKWRMTEVAQTSLSVQTVERFQINETDVRFIGKGFTPNDLVHISVENHVPMDHKPRSVASNVKGVDDDGDFEIDLRVNYIVGQPRDIPLIVRVTDDHGRTASELSEAFIQF